MLNLIRKVNLNERNLKLRSLNYVRKFAKKLKTTRYKAKTKQQLIIEIYEKEELFYCQLCDKVVESNGVRAHERRKEHKEKLGHFIDYQFNNIHDHKHIDEFLNSIRKYLEKTTKEFLKHNNACKQQLILQCTCVRTLAEGNEESTEQYYKQKLLSSLEGQT